MGQKRFIRGWSCAALTAGFWQRAKPALTHRAYVRGLQSRWLLVACFLNICLIILPAQDLISRGHFRYATAVGPPQEEQVLFSFIPISASYLYLFAISPEKELTLLFPHYFAQLTAVDYHFGQYQFTRRQLCPWLQAGGSQLRALVATQTLPELEVLLKTYRNAGGLEKQALFNDILMYLESLKALRYSSTASVPPWQSIMIPGADRPAYKSAAAYPEIQSGAEPGSQTEVQHEEITAVEFNYYYEIVIKYACE